MSLSRLSTSVIAIAACLAVCATPANAETSVSYDVVCDFPQGKHTIIVHFYNTEGGEYSTMVTDNGGVKVIDDYSDQFQAGKGGDLKVIVNNHQTGTLISLKRVPGAADTAVIHWANLEQLIAARC